MKTHRFFCALCDEHIEVHTDADTIGEGIAAADEHFRVLHPGVFAEIERWPDGGPVIVDDSLRTEDFIEGPADDETPTPEDR